MKPTTICAAFLLAITAFSGHAWARRGIYVDASAAPNGDGTITAPFQTIAQAMERAREIRKNEHSRIVVHVAPGVYNENFPIYVNVSNLELRGSTRLIDDEDDRGLPGNCGTDTAPAPCIEPGTETLITPTVPLVGQGLITVAPTKDSPADRLTDITISGFVFDGKAFNQLDARAAVFVDRVDKFSIHQNVVRLVSLGVKTRLSSGRIHKNFVYKCHGGITAFAGSEIYPAKIQITASRSINNEEIGAGAVGALPVKGVFDPNLKEIQTLYDPAQHPEQVPDKLVLEEIGNDFSHNGRFGIRFEMYNLSYDTTDNQPMTANITATLRDNAFKENGEYGITVEGAFATRTNPRKFTSVFNGSFEDNDFTGNGRAGVFAGFMLIGVVTQNPGLIKTFKYQQNSQFTLQLDDLSLSSGVDYDNPLIDPFDKQTPLNNQLTVNGDMLTGTHVTCHPPGLPCPP